MNLQHRLERLVSPETRQMLGIWYSTADLPTAVLGALPVPCLLRPLDDANWELTTPFWNVQIAADESFEANVLANAAKLTAHMAAALGPQDQATMN